MDLRGGGGWTSENKTKFLFVPKIKWFVFSILIKYSRLSSKLNRVSKDQSCIIRLLTPHALQCRGNAVS